MKQALKVIEEIKADYRAIEHTKSQNLINDKLKHIKALKRDLKEYCDYKGYNYDQLIKEVH